MSEIRATTISDAAGTGPVTLTKQSAAKAWAKYDGSSVIAGSFGVSSTVDESTTGRTDVNLTNAMVYTGNNYMVSATCNGTSGNRFATVSEQTSTSFASYSWSGNVRTDLPVGVSVDGDLA